LVPSENLWRKRPMAIRERINAVIVDWCGQGGAQDQNLQQQWQATRNDPVRPHAGMAFQPDGVQSLIDKVTAEFKKPEPAAEARKIVLKTSDFEPNGGVKTIDDLVTAVV